MSVNSRASSAQSLSLAKPSRTASQEWSEDGLDERDHSHLHTVIDGASGPFAATAMHDPSNVAGYDSSAGSAAASAAVSQQLLHPAQSSIRVLNDDDAVLDPTGGHLAAHHKSGPVASVFVLSATTLGAGILALPYAFSLLGWLFGSLLLVAIGFTSSYAISLLINTARAVGATTYEELGHAIFPKFGKRMVVTTTLVLIFGSLTAFFVIIADTITPAVQSIVGNTSSFFVRREILLLLVALLFVFPLCMLKSIDALERWSFLAVGIILAFSIVILVDAIRALHNGTAAPNSDGVDPDVRAHIRPFFFSFDTFEALPIICLAFTCQTMIFPIWNNLAAEGQDTAAAATAVAGTHAADGQDHPASSSLLSPSVAASTQQMQWVTNRALLLCGLLYLPVGLFGFFDFGLSTDSDVLNNFPTQSAPFYDTVRILFVVAIGIHYPIVHFGFRSAILSTWYHDQTERQNRLRFWVITTACVICSLLLALALPNLKDVFGLTGSICAFPYCFMFPTAFYLRMHQPNSGVIVLADQQQSAPRRRARTMSIDGVPEGIAHGASGGDRNYAPLTNGGASEHGLGPDHLLDGAGTLLSSASASSSLSRSLPLSSGPPVLSTAESPLLASTEPLPMRQKLPAYALLVLASLLWVISIAESFHDMIVDFQKNGV